MYFNGSCQYISLLLNLVIESNWELPETKPWTAHEISHTLQFHWRAEMKNDTYMFFNLVIQSNISNEGEKANTVNLFA